MVQNSNAFMQVQIYLNSIAIMVRDQLLVCSISALNMKQIKRKLSDIWSNRNSLVIWKKELEKLQIIFTSILSVFQILMNVIVQFYKQFDLTLSHIMFAIHLTLSWSAVHIYRKPLYLNLLLYSH